MDQKICVKTIHFSFQIHVFSLQNHCFLRSRCIDGLQKLNKSCKKSSFFIEKPSFFREKSTYSQLSVYRWSPKNLQKSFIFHSKHIFFNEKSTFSSFSIYRWRSNIDDFHNTRNENNTSNSNLHTYHLPHLFYPLLCSSCTSTHPLKVLWST